MRKENALEPRISTLNACTYLFYIVTLDIFIQLTQQLGSAFRTRLLRMGCAVRNIEVGEEKSEDGRERRRQKLSVP